MGKIINSFSPKKAAPSQEVFSFPFVLICFFFSFIPTLVVSNYFLIDWYLGLLQFENALIYSLNSALFLVQINSDGVTWSEWFNSLSQSEQNTAFSGVAMSVFIATCIGFIAGRWGYCKTKVSAERKISGSDLLEYKNAEIALNKALKEEIQHSGIGIPLHSNINSSKQLETRSLLICGQIGSGKTQIILPLIQDVLRRKGKSFIFDVKGDFSATFRHLQQVEVLAPWDKNSIVWSISKDVVDHHSAILFASALIPKNDKDPMWSTSSRIILAACCEYLIQKNGKNWGWKSLAEILNLPDTYLHRELASVSKQAANLVIPNSKTSQSMLLTLYGFASPIFDLATAWGEALNGISLKSWVTDKNTFPTLIVQSNPSFETLSESIANIALEFISKELLSQPDDSSREIYFFLDEAALLNFDVGKFLITSRSKGGRIVLGIQSLELLTKRFTKDEINALSSMVGTLIVLRQGGLGNASSELSNALGEQQIERLNNNFDKDDKSSFSWQRTSLPVVSKSDLVNLPQASKKNGITGYLTILGIPIVAKLNWKLTILPQRSKPFEPAEWLVQTQTKNSTERNKSKTEEYLDKTFEAEDFEEVSDA
jgi:type IV secretory pathway TraG/TraD family ATPase VirD4